MGEVQNSYRKGIVINMKITMLGHKRIPSREGGVEIVVEKLAVGMAVLGHEVTVYNRKGAHVAGIGNEQKEYGKNYNYKGVFVKTVFTCKQKSLNAIVYSFLATLRACFSGAEVIHFHAEGPCSMIPIAKFFHKKCVATIHGLDWQRAKWGGFATKFLLFGEKMAARYADEVIVLSAGVKQYFLDTYNRKTIMIPNGIDKPQYHKPSVITDQYGLHGQDYLLFLARLVPEKGAHLLLEAYQKSGLKIPLVIAGGSSHSREYCEKIEVMAEKINKKVKESQSPSFSEPEGNREQKVILTGFVQGRELEELYSNALLYILPSEIEGMPLSLLEAMSYGTLCLTSDIAENTDVTEGHGFSFDSGNVDSLTEKLIEICDQINLIRSKEQYTKESIQNFILQKYNWDEVVKSTLACYMKLLK